VTPHADPITPVVLALATILVAAKLGGGLAVRLRQPAVLGELVVGVALGSADLFGLQQLDFVEQSAAIDVLARLGVIILLFEVGLESTVRDMMKVGVMSLVVAVLGVVAPFFLGWGVSAMLLPEHSVYVHVFLGATLTATSVGITARVLKELGHSQSSEARIILGAAVIDDVLGLVILAVVAGVIGAAEAGQGVSVGHVALVLVKALVFLVGALLLGMYLSPRLFRVASRLHGAGVLLAMALAFCFALSWLAAIVGLAPIVGAYAAGLTLEDVHYKDFTAKGEVQLEELVRPISSFLVPVFFVLMGMRVDLRALARPEILGLAAALTAAAIAGKQVCSLAVAGRGPDWLTVGVGMIPRGEVGLIFANMGLGMMIAGERIIDQSTYSACVIMVIVTTMSTPPLLKWAIERAKRRAKPDAPPAPA
jgi:Na+:H+ antiporter